MESMFHDYYFDRTIESLNLIALQDNTEHLNTVSNPLSSHPVKAPQMAPLVMHYEFLFDHSWGWSSGIVCVPSSARRGFKTTCNDFLFSRLQRSQRFLRRFSMIAIETTFTIINCIGDYYFNIDTSETYPTSVYWLLWSVMSVIIPFPF